MAMIGRKAAVAEIGEHRHEMHGRLAFAAWLGVHAQLLANTGAELKAFIAWAEEFYLRPHHRSAKLLDPATVDKPRIDWHHRHHPPRPGCGRPESALTGGSPDEVDSVDSPATVPGEREALP